MVERFFFQLFFLRKILKNRVPNQRIIARCGCIPHYFPNTDTKFCGVIKHAKCVAPLIHLFKSEGNRCLAACDSRFYKQETIMVKKTQAMSHIL